MTNIEHKPVTALERVTHAAHNAMITQMVIEEDNIESELAVKMTTARMIAIASIAYSFQYDAEQMDKALEQFVDDMTEHLEEVKRMMITTKH